MGKIEPVSSANTSETLAYLARRPYDNVYVSWLIAARRLGSGEAFAWRGAGGDISGVCYLGPQIVPCGGSDAIDAFASASRRVRSVRMIVGPTAAVEQFWSRASGWLGRTTTVRASQPVYALAAGELRAADASGDVREGDDVRRAALDELDELVPHSARMIAGEIGGDYAHVGAEFRTRTARLIEAGWWWRYRERGKLAFMCNVGSVTSQTAQLQGVWTPPEMRGRGLATRGMAAICARLLEEHRTLCLYVNDFNAPAIALYERLGFTRRGEFRTLFLA